jgi:hypothetical protein
MDGGAPTTRLMPLAPHLKLPTLPNAGAYHSTGGKEPHYPIRLRLAPRQELLYIYGP